MKVLEHKWKLIALILLVTLFFTSPGIFTLEVDKVSAQSNGCDGPKPSACAECNESTGEWETCPPGTYCSK